MNLGESKVRYNLKLMNTTYQCENCKTPYPDEGMPFICPVCSGYFSIDIAHKLTAEDFKNNYPGIWRFVDTFGLPKDSPISYLGEGRTPLINTTDGRKRIFLKMESHNPTLSFKDRGSALLISKLRHEKVTTAVEDSSGNAGASFAAYCSAFKITSEIFIPSNTSGPKKDQIEAYGAKVVRINGSRSDTAFAALNKVMSSGIVYASHAYQPFGMAGIATIAYEIFEQMNEPPDAIFAPIGHGSLFLGLIKGFEVLKNSGFINELPEFIGVQASHCAPVWARWSGSVTDIVDEPTIAEGVRVSAPIRGHEIISMLAKYDGRIESVQDEELICAWDELRHKGIFLEPTSALTWAAYHQNTHKRYNNPVLIMTGYGLKSNYSLT
jgi:threonine synthase